MSKGLRAALLSTALAFCAGSVWVAPAQSQQLQRREGQPFPQQDMQQIWEQQQSEMRARLAGATQQLQGACGEELRNFCGTVTPGEGRLLLCMQAHEDKLGRRCELALLEVSRSVGRAIRRVERFAEACWNDIQAHCGTAGGSIAQCMVDKRESLSAPCRAIVAATQAGVRQSQTQQPAQPAQPAAMTGLAIYSTDGARLGEVTGVRRRPDGSVEAIEAELGSPLGMGATGVLISPGDVRWTGDHIELQMAADQVRSILQGQRR